MATIEMLGKDAIEIDLRDYPAKVALATRRALNRAITSAQSVMTKEIAGETGLKQKDVREAMSIQKASGTHMAASLGASLKRISLMKFHAKGPIPTRGKGRGVTYRLNGGKGRLAHAFIATMESGHQGVFERSPGKFMRKSKTRQAIHEKYGPSIGQVFRKFRPVGLARALEVFQTNFDHELQFANSPGQADV